MNDPLSQITRRTYGSWMLSLNRFLSFGDTSAMRPASFTTTTASSSLVAHVNTWAGWSIPFSMWKSDSIATSVVLYCFRAIIFTDRRNLGSPVFGLIQQYFWIQ